MTTEAAAKLDAGDREPHPTRYTWERFHAGSTFVTAKLTVTETHIVSWSSLTGDWVPLHTDAEYAKTTPFGQRVAHGPLTMSLALGLGTHLGIFSEVVAWLGLDNVRALGPVFIGDTIGAALEVTTHRETSKADRGLCVVTYTVTNQRDETVMTFDSSLLIRRDVETPASKIR